MVVAMAMVGVAMAAGGMASAMWAAEGAMAASTAVEALMVVEAAAMWAEMAGIARSGAAQLSARRRSDWEKRAVRLPRRDCSCAWPVR